MERDSIMGDDDDVAMLPFEDYISLSDFSVKIDGDQGDFSLSFWVYLLNNPAADFPLTVIKQVCSDISSSAPFLFLNEKKIMMLMPSLLLHEETLDAGNSTSLTEVSNASMKFEFPLENWIHVGCEVCSDVLRLHINGEIVGERLLSSSFDEGSKPNNLRKITLVGSHGDEGLQGYVHNAEILPLNFSIKDHYIKDPPLYLSIDSLSTSEIEEESDGVWNIVGGKASCRRIFSMDVVLLNANGQAINKELEVVASLIYADNGLPVEKTSDDEAPLLTAYDGIEFDSIDQPIKLMHGRASFKLKISQLSSKCDNRLFKVKFEMPKFKGYHFLKAFSYPLRCISRSRNPRPYPITWKRPTSTICLPKGSQSIGLNNGAIESRDNFFHEIRPSPPLKRVKLGLENTSAVERPDEECNSHARTTHQDSHGATLGGRPENNEEVDRSLSDRESYEETDLDVKVMSSSGYSVSDVTIFKYCLGGLTDRALLLKEVATSVSEDELLRFAHEVSIYSGCSHHGRQIMIAKRLIEEGTKVWKLIARNNHLVHWENVVFEIEEQFMKIACCSTRSLTEQDFDLLRKIAGCQEYVAQENFEKMWCWLYPIAFTISREGVRPMWNSTSPKWIEGFITKEEAESSLRGPRGLQEPGTFTLRFPTSRSWPHPDAGSLVVTYVGRDYTLRHRLLSLDHMYSSYENELNVKPLTDLLMEEPELSRLGRIMRSQ